MPGFEDIFNDEEVRAYIHHSNEIMGAIGYTEHGLAHCKRTADICERILRKMGYDERTCELGKIAGYIHDIGNMINRQDHAQSGGLMAFTILKGHGFSPDETAKVSSAVSHHDERTAAMVNPIAAALIIADKSDVRRSRVRDKNPVLTDIHDRVNFAARKADLKILPKEKLSKLILVIDTEICAVMDYFEIFLDRMILCRKAASYLGCNFELIINDIKLL